MAEHRTVAVRRPKGSPSDVESRNSTLVSDRNVFLDQAREYSRFTLPSMYPDNDGTTRGAGANQHGFQSIGAQAVNHLSNKLVINMFPVGRSFFKLEFNELAKASLKKEGHDATKLSELLVKAEKQAMTYTETIAARVAYTEAMKSLIISGNILMALPEGGKLQAIKLDRYVLQRDLSGNLLELIITQKKAFSALSPDIIEGIKIIKGDKAPDENAIITIYTWVVRQDHETFTVTQAVEGIVIKEPLDVPEGELPWIPLRWNSASGEDYGRGHVEDYAGDFYVVEFLSEALVKGMAMMADIKYLIKPGSETDIDEISTAPSGEWIFGNMDDVGILQLERLGDFTPIVEVLKEYEKRIGQAFLLNSAARRDAERVDKVALYKLL